MKYKKERTVEKEMARQIHVVFELTMPHAASWNGRWSGEGQGHYIFKDFSPGKFAKIENQIIGSWHYRWDDGWCACVTSREIEGQELRKLRRQNRGFCGYDWMVEDILLHGEIKQR